MNRTQFCEISKSFVLWAGKFECDASGNLNPSGIGGALSKISITLDIPHSSKVQYPINGKFQFNELINQYSWRAKGMSTGDFNETRSVIESLSTDIVQANTSEDALIACKRIIGWGGDRNSKAGATIFLEKKGSGLLTYLKKVKGDLALKTAVIQTEGALSLVEKMNSMLTKIHAFNSDDGLPIYDSRVAGAIATLVETWRRTTGYANQPLPTALLFPAVGSGGFRRSVLSRYHDGHNPGSIYYFREENMVLRTSREWASAKVRLGWLLSELLIDPNPKKIRSLEACLFMAGYNCAGINSK